MAKTVLEIEGGKGWEAIIDQFEKAISSGEKLVDTTQAVGSSVQDAARKSIDAQTKANEALRQNSVEVVKSGALQRSLNEEIAKGNGEALKGMLREMAAMEDLSDAEKVAMEGLVDLVAQFQKLNEQGAELERKAAALEALGDAAGGTGSAEEQAEASRQLAAAREELTEALARNREEVERLAQTLAPLMEGGDADDQMLQGMVEGLHEAFEETERLATATGQASKAQQKQQEGLAQGTKTLSVRLREAVQEVARLRDELPPGVISDELLTAAANAAELKEEMQRVKSVISVMDDGSKFELLSGGVQNLVGGISAVAGALNLVGANDDNLEKSAQQMLALLTIMQGASNFLDGFSKNLKKLNDFVIANTGLTKTNTISKVTNAEATAAESTATTTNTGVKVANAEATMATAGANTTAATATGGLTGAVRALTAVMAANPITTAAVVLAGIAGAFLYLSGKAEMSAEKAGELVDKLQELRSLNSRNYSLLQRKNDLEDELDLIQKGNTEEGRRELIMKRALNEKRTLQAQVNDLLFDESILRDKIAKAEVSGSDEAREKLQKEMEGLVADRKNAGAEIKTVEKQLEVDLAGFDLSAAQRKRERMQAEAKASLELRKRLEEETVKAIEDIRQRAEKGQRDQNIAELEQQADQAAKDRQYEAESEFRQRIIAIKEAAQQEEITALTKGLQRKIALQQVERSEYEKLSEAERTALADRMIAAGKAELTEEQMAAVKQLRQQASAQAAREVAKVEIGALEKRTAAVEEAYGKEVALIGQREQLASIQLDNAKDDLGEMRRILEENGVQELDQVRNLEDAKLALQIATAKKRIELLQSMPGLKDEEKLELEQLKAQVEGWKKELDKVEPIGTTEWWANFLGIDAGKMEKLAPLVKNALGSIAQALDNTLFTQRIADIDKYIDRLHESMEETEEAIDREQEAQEQGLTNNLAGEQARLEQLKQMEDKAIHEREKVAKRKAVADAIAAQSGTILSVVNLIKEGSSFGVVGLAIAAAAIPLIFSLINGSKAQAANVAKFWKGTDYVDLLGNPDGVDTVPAMLTKGEAVIRKKENAAMPSLIRGIHRDDPELVKDGLVEALQHYGIDIDDLLREFGSDTLEANKPRLPTHVPREIRQTDEELAAARAEQAMSKTMEHFMERIASNTDAMVKAERERETTTPLGPVDQDVRIQVKKGGTTRIITMKGKRS